MRERRQGGQPPQGKDEQGRIIPTLFVLWVRLPKSNPKDRRRQPRGQNQKRKDIDRHMANLMEEFEALLQESFEMDTPNEGSVVKGKVIAK